MVCTVKLWVWLKWQHGSELFAIAVFVHRYYTHIGVISMVCYSHYRTVSTFILLYRVKLLLFVGLSVPISRFYSFAGSTGDRTFTNVDDQSTSINLSNGFIFMATISAQYL